MEQRLVSTIVVAYNNWPDVELAIQSALCQSYRSTEVIVVDNSSQDETAVEVPKRFAGKIVYIRQPNLGDAGAYNTGLKHARGEFIQFLDGDDFLSPYKVEKQVEIFDADPAVDIVFSDQRCFQSLAGCDTLEDFGRGDHHDMIAASLPPINGGVDSQLSALFRRSALDRVGPWDTKVYVSDLDYWLRAAAMGCRFRHCKNLAGFARLHPGQMSRDVVAVRRGREAVLMKALTYIQDEPHQKLLRGCLEQVQFFIAILDSGLTKSGAFAKLRQARENRGGTVSAPAYWIAAAVIFVPGALRFARSPSITSLRRFAARLSGLKAEFWDRPTPND